MEHDVISILNRGDKKADESFMYFIIENVVKKCFRNLMLKFIAPVSFFAKPEMNV